MEIIYEESIFGEVCIKFYWKGMNKKFTYHINKNIFIYSKQPNIKKLIRYIENHLKGLGIDTDGINTIKFDTFNIDHHSLLQNLNSTIVNH